MNLTDKDILELNGLCNALMEGTLTEAQKARLSHWLATSPAAREYYVRAMGLSASLFSYASEMQTGELAAVPPPANIIPLWRWAAAVLTAAAAMVALMLWINPWPKHESVGAAPQPGECIAQLTGSKNCEWAKGAPALQPGGRLHKGQRIELARGFAEITFDSGAQVVLEGPASFDATSAWEAVLHRGTLKASVPPQAIGFRISNPAVDVVDLGTVFSMSAEAGAADVLVLKGEVEAKSSATGDRQPIVLREKESRRFANSGVSDVPENDLKLSQFTQPIVLDRFDPPTDCLHWSFDESTGSVFEAEALGQPAHSSDAWLKNISKSAYPMVHLADGYREGAVRFDGHMYARAMFPGMSGMSPHSVVFWARIPKDAKLSNAYAMVAWSINSETMGSHPIHISWNRNPNEGTVGVLRTDYGGGFALGSTPLRDGQWHHIAVVFIPSEDLDQTVEVKQYVDGRLEGEGGSSPPGSDIFFKNSKGGEAPTMIDGVWLGCRLGISDVRTERFRGDMDELFIVDRPLVPQEIVQLMNHNQLQFEMAAVK